MLSDSIIYVGIVDVATNPSGQEYTFPTVSVKVGEI